MVTPASAYEKTASAYADAARRLFSIPGAPAAYGVGETGEIEAIAAQAGRFAPLSQELTATAVERLDALGGFEREAAAAQLLAKALVDLQVSAFLAQAAAAEEQGADSMPESPVSFAGPFDLAVEEALAIIEGKDAPLSYGLVDTQPAQPADLPAARVLLIQRVAALLDQVEARTGRTAQRAVSSLVAMGAGQVAQAAGLIGMNIAQALGAAGHISRLYALVREFFLNAYQALVALIGPSLAKTAADQVIAWVNDILQGEHFTALVKRLYETSEVQQELLWLVETNEAGLVQYAEALHLLEELDRQHQKQTFLIERMIQVLRFVPALPAAALPQAQLLLGAVYITISAYAVISGADYVDAPSFAAFDRVPGPREILYNTIGGRPTQAAKPDFEIPYESAAPDEAYEAGAEPEPEAPPPPPPAPPPEIPHTEPSGRGPEGIAETAAGEDDLIEEFIRLDLAVPSTPVVVGRAFEIAVAIRRPASALLAVDGLESVHSADGVVYRESDEDIIRYTVKVSAPECDIDTDEYTFLLRAGRDSPPRFFQLIPRQAGELSIVVTAYQEGELIVAQTRVRVKATVQAVDAQPVEDARDSLLRELEQVRAQAEADNPLRLELYRALCGPAFTLEDLEELCFILNLDWDLLEGETKDRKARAMIRYFSGRDDLLRLNQAVKEARPNLDLG